MTKVCGFARRFLLVAACGAPLAAAAPAQAAGSAVALDGNLGVVSDYRWRGLSLSERKGVVQGGVDLTHGSGAFIGVWGSSMPKHLGSAEVDLSAGWSGEAGDTSFSISALTYLYPSLENADYVEFTGSVTHHLAPVELTGSVSYAPDQQSFGRDDLYLSSEAKLPLANTGFAATAHLGWERGPYNLTRTKLDWSAGLTYSKDLFEIGVTYTDTDQPGMLDSDNLYGPAVLVGVSSKF